MCPPVVGVLGPVAQLSHRQEPTVCGLRMAAAGCSALPRLQVTCRASTGDTDALTGVPSHCVTLSVSDCRCILCLAKGEAVMGHFRSLLLSLDEETVASPGRDPWWP